MMHDHFTTDALRAHDEEARFGERLAALAEYRALRERRWRKAEQRGDRQRLREVIDTLERTGGLPADWLDPRV